MSKSIRIVGIVVISIMILLTASMRYWGEAFAYFLALLAWYVACLQQSRFDEAQRKIGELEKRMPEAESIQKEKPEKKSMLEVAVDSLSNLKPGEWHEHCQKADAAEDAAIGHSALEQPQAKTTFKPLFPPNPYWKENRPLSREEQARRADVLEELLELEDEEKGLEEQIERRRLRRKELLERLNQVPKRN